MATILNKDVVRESTTKYQDRNINITLTSDQKISLKLKGMKSGDVIISIGDLYKYLLGDDYQEPTNKPVVIDRDNVKKSKVYNNSPIINLYDLRSISAITPMENETKVLFEEIINRAIKSTKKIENTK